MVPFAIVELSPRKRLALQWLCVATLFTIPTIGHIFAVPFLLYKNPKHCNASDTALTNNTSFVCVDKTLRDDLFQHQSYNKTSHTFLSYDVDVSKNLFFTGLFVGGLVVGPMTSIFGRKTTFNILIRTLSLSSFFLSTCGNVYLFTCLWFLLGTTVLSSFSIIFVELLEKIDSLNLESFSRNISQIESYHKFKWRLFVGIGFMISWPMSRLTALMIFWLARDWTFIYMWLALILTTVNFCFGDFFLKNFNEEQNQTGEESSFFATIKCHPVIFLNILILSLNWFVGCHNLYGFVIAWDNISLNEKMFENTIISSSFAFISIPLCFAVCTATKQKLLPFGLLQLFSGVSMFVILAFHQNREQILSNENYANGGIFAAQLTNVLVTSALCILWVVTIETFPQKFRVHCLGICNAFARIGMIIGVYLNDTKAFNGPSCLVPAGILSIVSAVLSRLLPDLTRSQMLDSQSEIEQLQFTNGDNSFFG